MIEQATSHWPLAWQIELADLGRPLGLGTFACGVTAFDVWGPTPPLASPHAITQAMALCMAQASLAATSYGALRGIAPQRASLSLLTALQHVHAEHMFGPTLNGRPLASNLVRDNPLLATPYRCQDGQYFMPSALHPQGLLAWLRALGAPPTERAIGHIFASMSASQADLLARRAGLPGAICRSEADFRASPQGRCVMQQEPVHLRALGTIGPMPPPAATRPLAGVRVLLLTQGIAGPLVGRTLAEQGAQVVHLAHPEGFEHEAVWCEAYVGCRSMGLDLRRPEGVACAEALMACSDVLVCSLQARAQQALGLDAASLHERHPHLVPVHLSAYGDRGPDAGRPGFDMNAMATTGMMVAEAETDAAGDGPPRLPPTVLLNDFLMGYAAAAGAAAALCHRATSGTVYGITLNLCRLAMWCQDVGRRGHGSMATLGQPAACDEQVRTIEGITPLGVLRRLAPGVQLAKTPGMWRTPMLEVRGSLAMNDVWPA